MSGGNGQGEASRRRQHNKRGQWMRQDKGGGQCGLIRWQATQGDMAVDDKTREGEWRTQHGAIGVVDNKTREGMEML
jgi:hypothetical protein